MHPIALALAVLAAAPAGAAAPTAAPADAPAKPEFDPSKLPFTEFSIKEVVRHKLPDIQQCYETAIKETGKNPPEGRVVVNFKIVSSGATSDASIKKDGTTLKNNRVQECVLEEVRAMRFPAPTDNREHPIVFPFDLKVAK
jgi:hypothetical protein